jgi:putative nucleotidyltransferase-like protein
VEGSTAAQIRALLQRTIDWELLVRAASPQGVLPLLYTTLNRNCPEAVPETMLRTLRARFHANVVRNLAMTSELLRLLRLFRARGLPAIPFKGPLLAASAYGSLALREFVDLDILVHPRDIPNAKDLLVSAGYRPQQHPPDWECHFIPQQGSWLVDLHQRIAPEYFPTTAAFEDLWAGLVPVCVGHTTVLTLPPEDLLITLTVQFAKDCRDWTQRLVQICDATELILTHPEMQWDLVLERARHVGCRRMLLLTLFLAHRLLGAKLPQGPLRSVQTDPVVKRLAAEVRARLFPEAEGPPEAIRFRSLAYHDSAFYLRATERLPDKLRYLGVRVRALVAPTWRDRDFVALPASIAFLYYVIRPIRLLTQWVQTGSLRPPKADPSV